MAIPHIERFLQCTYSFIFRQRCAVSMGQVHAPQADAWLIKEGAWRCIHIGSPWSLAFTVKRVWQVTNSAVGCQTLFQSIQRFHGWQTLSHAGVRLAAFFHRSNKFTVLKLDTVVG